MRLLRATLRWQAALWAAAGLLLLIAPGWITGSVLDQGPLDEDVWLRAAGVMAIALAAQMILVGHRIEELWWWAWTFVLLEVGTAIVFLANALVGVPGTAAYWPWWLLAVANASLAVLQVIGLALTGTQRSPA